MTAPKNHFFAEFYWFNLSPCSDDVRVNSIVCQFLMTSLFGAAQHCSDPNQQ